jgi:hypothetical protein
MWGTKTEFKIQVTMWCSGRGGTRDGEVAGLNPARRVARKVPRLGASLGKKKFCYFFRGFFGSFFVECSFLPNVFSTRQKLCRVPEIKHSAKPSLPTKILPGEVCRVWHSANALSRGLWPLLVSPVVFGQLLRPHSPPAPSSLPPPTSPHMRPCGHAGLADTSQGYSGACRSRSRVAALVSPCLLQRAHARACTGPRRHRPHPARRCNVLISKRSRVLNANHPTGN